MLKKSLLTLTVSIGASLWAGGIGDFFNEDGSPKKTTCVGPVMKALAKDGWTRGEITQFTQVKVNDGRQNANAHRQRLMAAHRATQRYAYGAAAADQRNDNADYLAVFELDDPQQLAQLGAGWQQPARPQQQQQMLYQQQQQQRQEDAHPFGGGGLGQAGAAAGLPTTMEDFVEHVRRANEQTRQDLGEALNDLRLNGDQQRPAQQQRQEDVVRPSLPRDQQMAHANANLGLLFQSGLADASPLFPGGFPLFQGGMARARQFFQGGAAAAAAPCSQEFDDEELARQLQAQFDAEDAQAAARPRVIVNAQAAQQEVDRVQRYDTHNQYHDVHNWANTNVAAVGSTQVNLIQAVSDEMRRRLGHTRLTNFDTIIAEMRPSFGTDAARMVSAIDNAEGRELIPLAYSFVKKFYPESLATWKELFVDDSRGAYAGVANHEAISCDRGVRERSIAGLRALDDEVLRGFFGKAEGKAMMKRLAALGNPRPTKNGNPIPPMALARYLVELGVKPSTNPEVAGQVFTTAFNQKLKDYGLYQTTDKFGEFYDQGETLGELIETDLEDPNSALSRVLPQAHEDIGNERRREREIKEREASAKKK